LRWSGIALLGYSAGVSGSPVGSRPVELDAFAHVKDERLRRLLRHWMERRDGGFLPKRAAIDPTAIGPILASVWMCDYLPDNRGFRMRLAGEDINRLYGRNVTQCTFEEIITPTLLPDLLQRYRRVVEDPSIMHCAGNIYLASDRSEVGERLVLPLADDSSAIRHVIGASVYRMELKAGEGPITRETMLNTFTPLTAAATKA